MKQSNIIPIFISVIAFLLFFAIIAGVVFLSAYHLKNPTPEAQTTLETHEKNTPGPDTQSEGQTPASSESEGPSGSEDPTQTLPTSPTGAHTSETSATLPPAVEYACKLKATSDAGMAYQNKITFLGDSTTYHMIINKVLPDGEDTRQVWFGAKGTLSLPNATEYDLYDHINAPSGDGKILEEMVRQKKPQILVITLGAGVSTEYAKDKFTLLYNAVIDTVLENSPSTIVICNSIYPVCRSGSAIGNLNNTDIRKANGWILECAQAHYDAGKKVYYLDSFSAIVDREGYLPDAYSNGDGIHMNEKGYQIILENLRRHKLPDVQ